MLRIHDQQQIYVYTDPVDMRKAVNGLITILLEEFDKNPQTGDLYVFVNRTRDKIKCLAWDKNGFVLYYKRLEQGRFNFSKYLKNGEIVISETQLKALLMGLDFYLVGENYSKNFEYFF